MNEKPLINEETGEVIRHKNAFMCPAVEVLMNDFSNDEIIVSELVDKVEKGASGEDTDFITYKAPKLVEKHHHRKVIAERCKGQDLKSILVRVDRTGDISLINQKHPVYGDATKQPQTLGDALEKAKESAAFLDSLSASEKERILKLAKDPKEFDKFVAERVALEIKKLEAQKQVEPKEEPSAKTGGQE